MHYFTFFNFRLILILFIFMILGCHSPDIPSLTSPKSNYYYKGNSDTVIVFVHGLKGDPIETWTDKTSNLSWQSLIHNDENFKNYSIYNVSYDTSLFANGLNSYEIPKYVRANLEADGIFQYKHIHFITHSLGGLVIKGMLVKMKNSHSNLLDNIETVSFLATPSQGSSLANIANYFPQYLTSAMIQDLKTNDYNTYLVSLNDAWQDFFQLKFRPSLECWYETKPTNGFMVVNRNESSSYCDENLPTQKNHIDISKPINSDDDIYKQVMAHIRSKTSSNYSKKSNVEKIYWTSFPYVKYPLVSNKNVMTTEKRLEFINQGNEPIFIDNITLMSGACIDINDTGLQQRIWIRDDGKFDKVLKVNNEIINSPFVHLKLLPNEHIYIELKFDRYLSLNETNSSNITKHDDFPFPFLNDNEISDSIKSQLSPYILTIKSTRGYSECINLNKM